MSKLSFTSIPEATWRAAERDQIARERVRLHRNGTIRPRQDLPPTTLYKDVNGLWRRALGFFDPLTINEGVGG